MEKVAFSQYWLVVGKKKINIVIIYEFKRSSKALFCWDFFRLVYGILGNQSAGKIKLVKFESAISRKSNLSSFDFQKLITTEFIKMYW